MDKKILVLGAGTAGSAAASFLKLKGLEVIMIDRAQRPLDKDLLQIGESLSPDAAPLLKELGIWNAFCEAAHLKCFSNVSYWQSQEARHHDFIQHPIGHGWHLDRTAFDSQLLAHALKLAVNFNPKTTISKFRRVSDQWQVLLSNDLNNTESLTVDYVVDATGRNSWWARQQGVERLYEAEQLALVAFLDIDKSFEDTRTLVETTTNGWWYSAAIPGNRMATAFFCPPENVDKTGWLQAEGWKALLEQATQTATRIDEAKGQLLAAPRLVAAHSSILERLQGPGWMAVGDAALTYDPIAAHGITMALTSARDAAEAIRQCFQGDVQAPERYEALLRSAFQRYAQERQQMVSY